MPSPRFPQLEPLTNAATVRPRVLLEPLDAHLRSCMDGMWSQIQAAERRGGGGGSGTAELTELQSRFTHIHLATDVTQRTIELCKSCGTT